MSEKADAITRLPPHSAHDEIDIKYDTQEIDDVEPTKNVHTEKVKNVSRMSHRWSHLNADTTIPRSNTTKP